MSRQQSNEEVKNILTRFFNETWPAKFSHLALPIDEGKIVSQRNFDSIVNIGLPTLFQNGVLVTQSSLTQMIQGLEQNGLLDRADLVQITAEPEVAPEKPKNATQRAIDAEKARVAETKRLNDPSQDVIKGHASHKLKPVTVEEIAKAVEDDKTIKEIKARVFDRIKNYREGKSLGAREAQKQLLVGVFDAAVADGKSWPDIEAAVEAQIKTMSTWDASEAIRRVYADAAKQKGVDLTKRSENIYLKVPY